MPTYIALLRGVNVGGAKRVPMADLRRLLAGLGFTDVVTLLNSGNAVFDAKRASTTKLAASISDAIRGALGFDVAVIVKSAGDLAAAVEGNPFADGAADASRVLVAFTPDDAALARLAPLAGLAAPPERFHVGPAAAYLDCPAGVLASRVGAALLGKSGDGVTTRNWATVRKLHALVAGRDR